MTYEKYCRGSPGRIIEIPWQAENFTYTRDTSRGDLIFGINFNLLHQNLVTPLTFSGSEDHRNTVLSHFRDSNRPASRFYHAVTVNFPRIPR